MAGFNLCISFVFLLIGATTVSMAQPAQEHASLPAFRIAEKDAHLECISYDPIDKSFFLGSVHKRKVIKIDSQGRVSDFITEMQDSLLAVLGLKADSRRKLLWVCCTALPEMKGYKPGKNQAAVFAFNLSTGKLIKKYIPVDKGTHILGEPVITKDGTVYISDGGGPNIYRIGKADTLELFVKTTGTSLQGMALSEDDKILFFSDYDTGLYQCNIQTKAFSKLQLPYSISIKGVDGLYYYRNSLVSIQNGVRPAMICQYFLNNQQGKINSVKILEKNHPLFNEPTCGTIVNDTLYYIANSQWSVYDKNHNILPMDQLQEIQVLKLPLASH